MKLQQLKYLLAIVDNGLNITAAAESLYTSQPGVSKQLKLLEEELGMQLFVRKGKSLGEITAGGHQVIERARVIMREAENIRILAKNFNPEEQGSLAIAATPTQAKYVLPNIITKFEQRFPKVSVHVHQGTSEQIANLMAANDVDFAIASGPIDWLTDVLTVPAFHWHRSVVVPKGHELTKCEETVTLHDLAKFPLVSYTFGFGERSTLKLAFEKEGLEPEVVFPARDSDVIRTYVRMGLGVGIIASMAMDRDNRKDLVVIDEVGLLPKSTTWIAYRQSTKLHRYSLDFLRLFAAHLSVAQIDEIQRAQTQQEIDALLAPVALPIRGNCDENVTAAA